MRDFWTFNMPVAFQLKSSCLLVVELFAMAPHLIAKELDILMQAVGKQWPPKEIHRAIAAERLKKGIEPPKIWANACFLQGRGKAGGCSPIKQKYT